MYQLWDNSDFGSRALRNSHAICPQAFYTLVSLLCLECIISAEWLAAYDACIDGPLTSTEMCLQSVFSINLFCLPRHSALCQHHQCSLDKHVPVQSELKACKTAASVTEVVDGFEVLRTASVAETFRLYAAITKRLAVCQQHVPMLPCHAHMVSSSAVRLQ